MLLIVVVLVNRMCRIEEEEKKDDEPGATNSIAEKKTEGSLKEGKEDTAVILVGDADMIYDEAALQRMNTPFGTVLVPANGNLTFTQNALEQLAGDKNLIAVRSRALVDRPLTRVKALEERAPQ